MNTLHTVRIPSIYGEKYIRVYHADVTNFVDPIDILIISTFRKGYAPSPNTIIDALWRKGINVYELARHPDIDMRNLCKTWLSSSITTDHNISLGQIGRIGCIEFSRYSSALNNWEAFEKSIIRKITALFRMFDIAATVNVPMHTIAMPMLGGGAQGIRHDLILVPLLREIVEYLMRSKDTQQVLLIDKSETTAKLLQNILQSEYFQSSLKNICMTKAVKKEKQAFISYSHKDSIITKTLCQKIEKTGIKVWYAERNLHDGMYAARIAEAIDHSSVFIPVMSRNSLYSNHVLAEVNMAFNRISTSRLFMPLFIDRAELSPAFEYYLNALECTYAFPPTDSKLDEFVSKLLNRYVDMQT